MPVKSGVFAPYRSPRLAPGAAEPPRPGEVVGDRYVVEQLLSTHRSVRRLVAIDVVGQPPRRVVLLVLHPEPAAGAEPHARAGGDAPGADLRCVAEALLDALLRAHAAGDAVALERPADAELLDHRGLPVIALEHVAGASVKDRLARAGAMPAGEVARTGARIALALAALHRAGAAHGALRAANVRLREDGAPVLVGAGGSSAAAGEGAAEDMHALGLLLWEMAMGTRPRDAKRAVRAALAAAGKRAGRLPPALAAAILACIEEDPAARMGAAEVATMLEALAARATSTSSRRGTESAPQRRWTTKAALGLIGAVMAGGALASAVTAEPAVDAPEVSGNRDAPPAQPLGIDCKMNYNSIQEIPEGAQILDFETCSGCDCCFGGKYPDAPTLECNACAMGNVLRSAGLTMTRVEPAVIPRERAPKSPAPVGGHVLRVRRGMTVVRIELQTPVALFGMAIRPGLLSGQQGPATQEEVELAGYDARGVRVGLDRADYEATYDPEAKKEPRFAERARFLAVASCDGAKISVVELRVPRDEVNLDSLTLYPPVRIDEAQ